MSNNIKVFTFLVFFQANGEAAQGKYAGGEAGAATGESLYVANHAY